MRSADRRSLPAPLGRRALMALGVGLLGAARVATAQPIDASSFIRNLGEQSVAILRNGALDDGAKLERLVGLLHQATDLPLVARLVLGRHWREASEPQRQRYTQLFQSLVIKTMAQRLSAYGGETFKIIGARETEGRDSVVSTRIFRPSGPPIDVDWRVRESVGSFAVVDVVAEGISMVITQRSEVNEIVGRRGIAGLLMVMQERLDRPA
jgi:phospholipid transport system substrate-binding protein